MGWSGLRARPALQRTLQRLLPSVRYGAGNGNGRSDGDDSPNPLRWVTASVALPSATGILPKPLYLRGVLQILAKSGIFTPAGFAKAAAILMRRLSRANVSLSRMQP